MPDLLDAIPDAPTEARPPDILDQIPDQQPQQPAGSQQPLSGLGDAAKAFGGFASQIGAAATDNMQQSAQRQRANRDLAYSDIREQPDATASQRLRGDESPIEKQNLEDAFAAARWDLVERPKRVRQFNQEMRRPLDSPVGDDELQNYFNVVKPTDVGYLKKLQGEEAGPVTRAYQSSVLGLAGSVPGASDYVRGGAALAGEDFMHQWTAAGLPEWAGKAALSASHLAAQLGAGAGLGKALGFGKAGQASAAAATTIASGVSNDFREARERGLDVTPAAGYAAVNGLIMALTMRAGSAVGGAIRGMLGGEAAVKQGIMSALGRTSVGTLKSIGEMNVMGFAQGFNRAMSGVDPEALKPDNLGQTIADATVNGIMFGVAGHAGEVGQAARQKIGELRDTRTLNRDLGRVPPPVPSPVAAPPVIPTVEPGEPPRDLSDPGAVKAWVDANPEKAKDIASKDSVSRSDMERIGVNEKVVGRDRNAFGELVKQVLSEGPKRPPASAFGNDLQRLQPQGESNAASQGSVSQSDQSEYKGTLSERESPPQPKTDSGDSTPPGGQEPQPEAVKPDEPFSLQQESATREPAPKPVENNENSKQDALFPKGGLAGQSDFLDQIPDQASTSREAKSEQPPPSTRPPLRKGKINEPFEAAGQEHGLHPRDIKEAAESIANAKNEAVRAHNRALEEIAKSNNVTMSKLSKAENAGRDPVEVLGDTGIHQAMVEAGWIDPTQDLGQDVDYRMVDRFIDMLRQGKKILYKPHDQEIIDQAVKLVKSGRNGTAEHTESALGDFFAGTPHEATPFDIPAEDTAAEREMAGSTYESRAPNAKAPLRNPPGTTTAPTPQPAQAGGQPPVGPPKKRFKPLDDFNRVFNPQARGEEAALTGRILRQGNSELAQSTAMAENTVKGLRKIFQRQTPKENEAFIDRIEQGQKQPSPNLQKAADALRSAMDSATGRVQALGTGKLAHPLENYFAHLWSDPVAAKEVYARLYGKRPLEGPAGFLKQRTIEFVKDGLANGLKLVTDNPVDLTMLKIREMDKYVAGEKAKQRLDTQGMIQYHPTLGPQPKDLVPLEGKLFTKYGPPEVAIQEAFDKLQVDKFEEVAKNLGVQLNRSTSIGGQRLGFAVGDKSITSKFGGPESVLFHEMGHILDARYDLHDIFGGRTNKLGKPTGRFYNKDVTQEFRDLADSRWEGQQVTEHFKDYVRETPEKMAVLLEAYLHAPELMKERAPNLYARFDQFLESHPELKPIKDIKPSLVLGTREGKVGLPGFTTVGRYYARPEVAHVINQFQGEGQAGNFLYDAARGVGNLLNQAQLSFSAFHATGTMLNAAISDAALGIEQASKGKALKGLGNILTGSTGLSGVRDIIRGGQIARAYREGLSNVTDPNMRQAVENVINAGGRIQQDGEYASNSARRFGDAMRQWRLGSEGQGRVKSAYQMATNAPGAFFETAAIPIMRWLVPRLKLGAFDRMASEALSNLGPDATPDQRVKTVQDAWDSIDNRFGQLVYDNLFWNKAAKDTMHLAVRSVGWNLGTLRELGGAPVDAVKGLVGQRGGEPYMTHKMAYAMALPMLSGLWGGMLHYLLTGTSPVEQDKDGKYDFKGTMKNLFYPKNGLKRPDGSDDRYSLPTYMKDVYGFTNHPLSTIAHKQSPLISGTIEALNNQDFWGNQIYDPENPGPGLLDYLKKSILPFSVRGAMQEKQSGGGLGRQILSGAGLTPAPAEITRTPAMNKARSFQPPGFKSQADQQTMADKIGLSDEAKAAPEGFNEHLDAKVAAGEISGRQASAMKKRQASQPLVNATKSLKLDQALDVYKLKNDEEDTPELKAAMEAKLGNHLKTAPINEAVPTLEKAKAAGLDTNKAVEDLTRGLVRKANAPRPIPRNDERNEEYQARDAKHAQDKAQAQAALKRLEETGLQIPQFRKQGRKLVPVTGA
jgi:hypothetical protein